MTWTAEELLPLLDYPRENGSVGLDQARGVLDSLLATIPAPVQLEAFSASPHRAVGAGLCLVIVAAGVALGCARPGRRWILAQIVGAGLALACLAGAFDAVLPHSAARNLIVDIPPRGPEWRTVMISAHLDTKTSPFDHVDRGMLLLCVALLLPLSVIAQARRRSPQLRWGFGVPTVLAVTLAAWHGLAPLWMPERSHGLRDNAVACAIALELTQRWWNQPLDHTRVRLAWWEGEEIGAQGSSAWVRAHPQDLPDAVINLELIGAGEQLAVPAWEWTGFGLRRSHPILVQRLGNVASTPTRRLWIPAITDAGAFLQQDVAALTLLNLPADGHWPRGLHRPEDDASRVQMRGLERTRLVLLDLLRHLDALPADAEPGRFGSRAPHM